MSMVFVAIAVLGFISYRGLPLELFPDTELPVVTVVTTYPGAGPDEIERLVTDPIESGTASCSGLDEMRSQSIENHSVVILIFVYGTDIDAAAADVRDKVSAVKAQLPTDAEDPVVSKFSFTSTPIMRVGVAGDRPSRDLKTLVDERVKDRLASIPGVANVTVSGGEVREIQIELKQDRLRALGLSVLDVRSQLVAQNLDLPGGSVDEGRREYSVRLLGEFKTVDEVSDVWLTTGTGARVRLTSLATVRDTIADIETTSRVNGKPSVSIGVQKASGANTVKVAETIRETVKELDEELPGDLSFVITRDESTFTEDALHDLTTSLALGVLMAALVVWAFLRSIPATTIVFLAIPTSMIATFGPISMAGYSLNFMSMLGLSLAVGALVDDSIVVLENIYRHLSMGKTPAQAALDGRMEIGLAAVSITLTDVVVFVPIAMMQGIVGQIFRPFGFTVAFAVLFSLFVSFTLTPMLAARWLKSGARHGGEEGDAGETAVRKRSLYVRLLSVAIHPGWRWLVAGGTLVVLWGTFALLFPRVGKEFTPTQDQGMVDVYLELPTGVRVEETDKAVREVERVVAQLPEVESYTAVAGEGSSSASGSHYGMVALKLHDRTGWLGRLRNKPGSIVEGKDGKKQRVSGVFYTIERLRGMVRDVPGADVRVELGGGRGPGGADVQVQLIGRQEDGLIEVHDRVLAAMQTVPELSGVSTSWKPGKPEVQAKIDRKRAGDLGFTAAELAQAIRVAVEGDTTTEYREAGVEYDVRIRLQEKDRLNPQDIGGVLVGVRNGRPIRLADVADIQFGRGPVRIDHKDRQQYVSVSGNFALDEKTGKPLTSDKVEAAVKKVIDAISLPPGIRYEMGGEAEFRTEAFGYMGEAMMLAVILVFLLLSALYESLFYPAIIMTVVPMAMVGGLVVLWLTGLRFGIVSIIGFIMLVGMVSKNSILLVDYTNTMRSRGMSRSDALIRSGPTRFRPIIMTTLSLVFALAPIASGLGKGAELRQPLAATVVGGMIVSTLLSLLVVPAFYSIVDDFQVFIYGGLKRFLFRLPRGED